MSDIQPSSNSTSTFSIIAIVLGGIAFLFFPIVLGPAAIILAVIAKTKTERLANVALAVAILGTVIGLILGAIIGSIFLS
jgi:mannitol-specific phosphotransferase system IIBC component